MGQRPRLFIGKNQQLTSFSGSLTNVQSYFGHAKNFVQKEFDYDISSVSIPNCEVHEMLEMRGWQNAIFSGEMNSRLSNPYPSVAAFEQALFNSRTYPYSTSGALVFMDTSSFNCDSGALHIREVNQQRKDDGRTKGRTRGMASERWLSSGLTITDCGTCSNKI
jgi:hypothetical protein